MNRIVGKIYKELLYIKPAKRQPMSKPSIGNQRKMEKKLEKKHTTLDGVQTSILQIRQDLQLIHQLVLKDCTNQLDRSEDKKMCECHVFVGYAYYGSINLIKKKKYSYVNLKGPVSIMLWSFLSNRCTHKVKYYLYFKLIATVSTTIIQYQGALSR